MCDLFWLSPADQGDLSDVVRASLFQPTPPHHRLLPTEEDDESLLLQAVRNCGDNYLQQQQLVHGDGLGLMVSSNSGRSCDHAVLLHPQAHQSLQPEGLIHQVRSGPPPQLDVEREEMEEHGGTLDMAVLAPHPHHDAQTIKRRKSQTKKMVCIPAPTAPPPGMGGEVVPSDLWAWRKYGQKPIKGSPYPRGYYRCSSSKGCSARKQVERSRTDPSMLVITYTSDHNHPWPTHRNALAGSTRPTTISSSSSASNKSHHHHHSAAAAAAAAAVHPPSPSHRHINSIVVSSMTIGDQEQVPKQEVLDHPYPKPEQDVAAAADHDLDMLADVDGALNNILSASDFINSKKYQQHATAADDDRWEKLPEEDDKQQQLDPFSFSFFDWVDTSFGVGGK